MTTARPSLDRVLELAQPSLQTGEGHPPEELWVDYAAGSLDDERVEQLRNHVASCQACLRTLREIQTFDSEPGESLAAGPQAAEARLMARVLSLQQAQDRSRSRIRRVAGTFACLALIGLAWSALLQRDRSELGKRVQLLLEPQLDTPYRLLDSSLQRGSTTGSAHADRPTRVEMDSTGGSFLLEIMLPVLERQSGRSFGIEIRRLDDTLLWSHPGTEASMEGSLTLQLHRDFVPSSFRVRVLAVDASPTAEPLISHDVEIAHKAQ